MASSARSEQSNALTTLLGNTGISTDLAGILVPALAQFIPGYSLISALISRKLGINTDKVIAILGFFFGSWAFFRYVKNTVVPKLLTSFTSQLKLDADDQVYDEFYSWILKKKTVSFSRAVKLRGNKGYKVTLDQYERLSAGRQRKAEVEDQPLAKDSDREFRNTVYNSKTVDASKPLQYDPLSGPVFFLHRGQLFFLQQENVSLNTVNLTWSPQGVTVHCFGLSNTPLRRLLEEVRAEHNRDRTSWIKIFRAISGQWISRQSKITRPFHSIVLREDQKKVIARDANDFMQPAGTHWYATHGVPYRRGYLFSGPPGTGKSSMSFALAGLLGLDIYCVSVSELKSSHHPLADLFNLLPNRCIVLLEDIDCAGINRSETELDINGIDKHGYPTHSYRNRPVLTLSDLLNTIDGVAAHEGHLLIMTTNKPEAFDAALKRPGRVDLHVHFGLATKSEIRRMFVHMYTDTTRPAALSGLNAGNMTIDEACRDTEDMTHELSCRYMPVSQLREMAGSFAKEFPDHFLSPAEVQGYLLMYRYDPHTALKKAAEWLKQHKWTAKKMEAERRSTKRRKST